MNLVMPSFSRAISLVYSAMKATDIGFNCHSIEIDILPVKELTQKDGQPGLGCPCK
jgi:hypothetical protein